VNKLKEYIKEKNKDKEKENNIDQDNKDINNENNINENKDITNNKISSNKSLNMKDYNNYKYISLLREKKFEKNEIWPVSKFLRAFFELKKLIYTYKNTKKDKIMEEIIKERDKDLTFQPNFNATTSYFKRKSINDKKEDIQNNSMNNSSISGVNSNKNKKKRDFNKMYEEFMLKKKMHEQALMILRQNKDKKEIKMCTDRPKINKHYKIKNRKKTPEVGCSRNEFLYKLNKEIQDTRKQKILERQKEIEEKETFSFMPTINKNLKKNYAEHPKRMPRGSEQYIKRNRSVIQFKKRQFNYQLNTDSNYEKEEHQKTNLHIMKDTKKKNNVNNVNNINKRNSQDDYFVGCSVKRLAPIIEIDVNNLQFSPSPARQYKIFSSRKKESRNKFNKTAITSNFKDIKIKRNDNKENVRPCFTNIDGLNSNNNGNQIRLFGKGGNLTGTGVNKWINLNKLINYDKPLRENNSNTALV
jgi:hypothetical protein